MSVIAAIPARLESTRFPRKVLADIHGKPMLWYVYQRVSQAKSVDDIWILTDSQEVLEVAKSWGAQAMLTAKECPSGTARIASVINYLNAEIIINVQGDEPLISSSVIDAIVMALLNTKADVATPVFKIDEIEDVFDANLVKVAKTEDGEALYFSRSPIPYVRDVPKTQWLDFANFWGHIGVYGFRRSVLTEYSNLAEGTLETTEKLEQLRILEAGKKIFTVEVEYKPIGVDVPRDLEVVRTLLKSVQEL